MSKYIKLEDAIDHYRLLEDISCKLCKLDDYIDYLPTIEVSEDCISKAYLEQEIENLCRTVDKDKEYWRGWNDALDKVVELIENAPSVLPSRANVECYVRTCEKNKNGRCEATDIILEFGCGE